MPDPGTDAAERLQPLEAAYRAGDPSFVELLLHARGARELQTWSARLLADPRPFARAALLAYIDDGCARPGHKLLVKDLVRRAAHLRDDEVMGRLMAALDRYPEVRKPRPKRPEPPLPDNVVRFRRPPRDPCAPPPEPLSVLHADLLRMALPRLAWHYLRRIALQRRTRYAPVMCRALAYYRDEQLERPAHLLNSWGFAHALFGPARMRPLQVEEGIPVIDVLLALPVDPMFSWAWLDCFEDLLTLAGEARSRVVRRFAVDMLRLRYSEGWSALPSGRRDALVAAAT